MPTTVSFPIVGVGASAGGIEALEGFFRGMPRDPGIAIVIVTHLSPERESLLHEIIARYTELPVTIAQDGVVVARNCVYVLPSNALLGLVDGRLSVSTPPRGQRERKPIDIFFSALAIDAGEHAAGVVLSGGDGDGTLGIKAIKERGGLTVAQVSDGSGPRHPSMPDSAIATGLVDFAITADQMGNRLAEFARSLELVDALVAHTRAIDVADSEDEALQEIYRLLRTQVGHEFAGYKTKTFIRRVHRRMQVVQLDTVDSYLQRLRHDPAEVHALFRDLLINVTNFFRDTEAFEALATTVIPKLFDNRGADDTVRVWVPGCATGEEVYSIAILLREQLDQLTAAPRVQVFATDIDNHALAIARAGRYPAALLDSVTPERRARFFSIDGGSFVVNKDVRDLCIFSPHSVIRDPPFSRLDMISCRNLLIYFGSEAQNRVIPIFHYALQPGGYLFLGMSESAAQFGDLFVPIEKKLRIFRSRDDVHAAVRVPSLIGTSVSLPRSMDMLTRHYVAGSSALRQTVESHVLSRFAPPHVVINGDGDIVYYSARTGKYLENAAGTPSRQLMMMIRKGLRFELRASFRESLETNRTMVRPNLSVESDDGRVQLVTLTIEPVPNRNGSERLFLVLFSDEGPTLSREEAVSRAQVSHDGVAAQFEQELRETRERLQSLVEEYETALEELKSSNEELVSVNEELQSSNEELEASKEELQSLNEELATINTELNVKIEALDRANDDLQNLFDSTDIAAVFLDNNLVIRSFTPAVHKIFNVLPSDRGRPITDLSSRFPLDALSAEISTVFDDGEPIERIIHHGGKESSYRMRLAPYRNSGDAIEGVVVTFLEVTSLVRAESLQQMLIAELQHRTRNLISVVRSVASQTIDSSGSLEAFQPLFNNRLAALGRAQGLLSRSSDEPAVISALVRAELSALGSAAAGDHIVIAGPEVSVESRVVQTLVLALHELATNALKYGALQAPDGHLSVRWQVDDGGGSRRLNLVWSESGVPMPMPMNGANPGGYGRKLLEEALAYELGATTRLEFLDDGIRFTLDLPLDLPLDPPLDPPAYGQAVVS